MERFPSLINSLKTGFEEGKSINELLGLLNEMRNELTGGRPAGHQVQSPVTVWFPAGYQTPPEKVLQPENGVKLPEIAQEIVEEPFISETIKESLNIQNIPAVAEEIVIAKPILQVSAPVLFTGVPRPPQVSIIEETGDGLKEDEDVEEGESTTNFSLEDDFLLPGNYHVQPSGIFRETMPSNKVWEQELHAELPIVVELELPEEPETLVHEGSMGHSMTIADNFLKSSPSAVTEGRPLELHEILANRVVAQPLNAEMPKQGKVLADTLAGSKINDLRKGIAINDRFRFIKSLFRGDESLFERSVKTINNFNILQEAQYWIQRELVIKLGWNEEDELVQIFYRLVSRRFL